MNVAPVLWSSFDDKSFAPQHHRDDDVLAEGEDAVVGDVAGLAESLLQFLLD